MKNDNDKVNRIFRNNVLFLIALIGFIGGAIFFVATLSAKIDALDNRIEKIETNHLVHINDKLDEINNGMNTLAIKLERVATVLGVK